MKDIEDLKAKVHSFDFSQVNSFKDLPISDQTKSGLRESSYNDLTDIQQKAMGPALKGQDILGAAKTGSGKTLGFLIPLLECLYKENWTQLDGLGALVITPTRELAYQIFEVINKVGRYHDFSVGLIIGGKDRLFEKKRMGLCNIVICTPGRLLDHMDRNCHFLCDNLKILVLDEADRILDVTFAADMNAIIQNLPTQRQTLLFSATQTKSVKDLARLSLDNPVYISVHENAKVSTPDSLIQNYITCEIGEKLNVLWHFLKTHPKQKIIVFMASCKQVKYVFELFCRLRPGISLLALHGSLHQMRRMAIYEDFCRKQNAVLFATDIASRGLDFPSVNWVLQLDCPEDVDTYIHRVGRTARYKSGGASLLVLLPSEEKAMADELSKRKIPIARAQMREMKFSIQRKAEALCARDKELKESAQRAFKAYFKNIYFMKNKSIFNVKLIEKDAFSRSLGLAITPRVRFIEKLKANKIESQTELKNTENDDQKEKTSLKQLIADSDDDDGDDNLFTVKSIWRFDKDDINEHIEKNEIVKKVITKPAAAKKMLKKKIKPNTKTLYNDEGQPIIDFPSKQTSVKVKEMQDQGISGIDIELAKEIMKEEDKVDKEIFKKLIKERHKEKKLKEKQKRKQSSTNEVRLKTNEDDDEEYSEEVKNFLDAIRDVDDDKSNESLNEELEEVEPEPIPKKRKKKERKTKTKKQNFDTGLKIQDDEDLALHLLSQK